MTNNLYFSERAKKKLQNTKMSDHLFSTRLTFPQAGVGRGRRLGHFQCFGPAAEGAGLTESPGEVLVHNVADVPVEISEENAAGAQVLCLCRLRAVLQLRVGRRSPA